MTSWNDAVIEQFRTNNGQTDRFGSNLVILHTVGAKTGEERLNPVMGLPHDGGWLVIASKAGAPDNPAWYYNLKAHPEITVEAVVDGNAAELDATATEVDDAGYEAAWAPFAAMPAFVAYAEKTEGRRMPIFTITPR